MSTPLLTDSFWTDEAYGPTALDSISVRRRIREELSQGRPEPITVDECLRMALDMGFDRSLTIHEEGAVAFPLIVIGAVWGHYVHGLTPQQARHLGMVLGSAAANDAGVGYHAEPEKKARRLLDAKRQGKNLPPEQSREFLDEVLAFFRTQ